MVVEQLGRGRRRRAVVELERAETALDESGVEIERSVAAETPVGPVTGSARVVAAAPRLALALGYDVEDALEHFDP